MKFNLQRFGGGKGGSTQTYEPSDEQKALWNLQIESAKARQPNEKYMNRQGRRFMAKVIEMMGEHGTYGDLGNEHNYLTMGNLAIDQTNNAMRKLVRVADWQKEFEPNSTVQASWQTETLVSGRNSQAAEFLQTALCGTGTIKATDSITGAIIRDDGFTGDLGGWTAPPYNELASDCTNIKTFLVGSDKKSGLNKNVGDLVTVVGGAVSSVNNGIDDYDGKFDSAATIAGGSVSSAQNKNNSLVGGLSTAIGKYNTLQSGKADTTESLLGGLNTSNNSAVTKAATVLQPLITDTRNAATTANGNLDTIQLKGDTALTTANGNLTSRSAESQIIVNSTNNTLKSVYSDYAPSRQAASDFIDYYRGLIDSETPTTNSDLDTLSADVATAYALANNHLAVHVSGDVADTATANNALITNRPNYNAAGQSLAVGLSGINADFNNQLKVTSALLGGYRSDSKTATNDYIAVTNPRISLNDSNADEIYRYSKNAATDTTNTAATNNADLSEYIRTNKGGLSDSKADLADLKNGVLPANYLQNMEDAIERAMKNTIGKTINTLGNRGVLNSSVTTSALNDIEKNAADQLAQKYLENIKTVQSLSNDQFDHVITTDHENAEMTRQKNDISQDALDRAFKYRQTGYEDLANNSDRNAELEKNILAASQANINQSSQLTQQDFNNAQNYANLASQNINTTYSAKMQSAQATDSSVQQQLGNSQASHNFGAQGTQNQYGNTMQGIQQRYGITNQQLSNIQAKVTEGSQLAQQDFNNKVQVGQNQERNISQQHANSVADVAQRADWGQQQYTNAYNQNQFDAGLVQNQFNNSQTGIQNAATFAQNMYGNSTNANQLNANNINSSYTTQSNAIGSNWERTQAGYNAGYQNNLQAINNAQTHWSNTVNGYNSEIGLHNNIFSNALQGVTNKANLYGQQFNQYSSMINSVGNLANYRANIALNTFGKYGDWALDVYRGKMQANAADTAIYQQAISQAGLPIQFAGAAQEGAMYLPTSMWNASIGLNAPTLGAMNGLAGTGKTTVVQNGGDFWGSFGAGVAGIGVQRLVGSL